MDALAGHVAVGDDRQRGDLVGRRPGRRLPRLPHRRVATRADPRPLVPRPACWPLTVISGTRRSEAPPRRGRAGRRWWRWSGPRLADTPELAPQAVLLVVLDRDHGLELHG